MEDPSETTYPRPLRAAARLLALELGAAPATAETLAAASGRLLDKLSQRLAQVIGPAGAHSILRRAVKLRKVEFPFLDERIVPSDSRASLAEPFRACLQEQEPAVIEDVSVTLFATFAGSLATLVGDRLTSSLLQQIWPDTLLPRTECQETEGWMIAEESRHGGSGAERPWPHQITFATATAERPGLYLRETIARTKAERVAIDRDREARPGETAVSHRRRVG